MDAFAQSRMVIDLFSDEEQEDIQVTPQSKKIRFNQIYIAHKTQTPDMSPGDQASKVPPFEINSNQEKKKGSPNKKNYSPSTPRNTRRVSPVSGDRSLTGGTTKPKITEEELSARLDKINLLNARNIETYRRQMADKAAFHNQDGKIMEQNKIKERMLQEEMERERLINRERKINCAENREWDMGKTKNNLGEKMKQNLVEKEKDKFVELKKYNLELKTENHLVSKRITSVGDWNRYSLENDKNPKPTFVIPVRQPGKSSGHREEQNDSTENSVSATKDEEWKATSPWQSVREWRLSQSLEPEMEMEELPSLEPAKEWEETPSLYSILSEPRKEHDDWAEEMATSAEENKRGFK